VHISKQQSSAQPVLDGAKVRRISAYLRQGDVDEAPLRLMQNPFYSKGSLIYGQGFLFDDTDPKASPTSLMKGILEDEPELAARISMFISGEDVNRDPRHASRRFVISLNDLSSENELDKYRLLADIVRAKVRPERMALGDNPNNRPLKIRWWAHQAHRPALYERIRRLERVLGIARVTPHVAFTFLPTDVTFAEKVILFDIAEYWRFSVLQSRVHDLWVRNFTSTLGDTLNYAATDCYETFPFPGSRVVGALDQIGQEYHAWRSEVIQCREEGLTKIYNSFHSRGENSVDIVRLRTLHEGMDAATLEAYGWSDLVNDATPRFVDHDADEGKSAKTRLDWSEHLKDEVLGRLLDLNRARADEERRLGLSPRGAALPDDADAEEAA
jgi:hypothetical protein